MDDNNQKKAIAFLGGTFDPIHFGHLRPALEISEALTLRQLYLMPNHIAPHKAASHANAKQRSDMVKLAIQDQTHINIDTRELNRQTPSYTIDTLKELKAQYPNTAICFIMGMDSLETFNAWYQWQDILKYCHLIISQRPGYNAQFNATIQKLVEQCSTTNKQDLHHLCAGKIFFQATSQLDISSTHIRKLLSNKKSIDYLVPENVNNYIKQYQLYQNQL